MEANSDLNTRQQIFSIDRAIMAPSVGFSVKQYWPYAPYHEMIVALPYSARAALLFFPIAALTLLICGVPVNLRQFAMLGALFLLPFLILMSSYVPYHVSITPAQFAGYQVKILPALSVLSLIPSFFLLRKIPRLPMVLVLLLMALAIGGYVFIGLLPDEQKRNSTETLIQACLIGYLFLLTLYNRLGPVIPVKQITSREYWTTKNIVIWTRRSARAFSVLLAPYWIFVMFWFHLPLLRLGNTNELKTILYGVFITSIIVACESMLVGWKNEKIGGILTITFTLFAVGVYLSRGLVDEHLFVDYFFILVIFCIPLMATGFLYLLGWRLSQTGIESNDTLKKVEIR